MQSSTLIVTHHGFTDDKGKNVSVVRKRGDRKFAKNSSSSCTHRMDKKDIDLAIGALQQ